jgi:hypothetical protein
MNLSYVMFSFIYHFFKILESNKTFKDNMLLYGTKYLITVPCLMFFPFSWRTLSLTTK